MEKIKPTKFISLRKLICDWVDRKKYSIHYRMLNFYVRHGMVIEKVYAVISFKQSMWLEKLSILIPKTEIRLKMILKKTINY